MSTSRGLACFLPETSGKRRALQRDDGQNAMTRDGKFVLLYAIVVVLVTLLYVTYEDLGMLGHARATPTAEQSDTDDDE